MKSLKFSVTSCAWQLSISYKKCSFMVIGKLKNEKDLSFHLGNNIISQQETAKDLGICTDSSLKFSKLVISTKLLLKHTPELVLYTSVSYLKTETF